MFERDDWENCTFDPFPFDDEAYKNNYEGRCTFPNEDYCNIRIDYDSYYGSSDEYAACYKNREALGRLSVAAICLIAAAIGVVLVAVCCVYYRCQRKQAGQGTAAPTQKQGK